MSRTTFRAALAAFTLFAGAAAAQDYPTRPITFIVPWAAGSGTDLVMRALSEAASKDLGQPIIVENKAGGGGTVGPATMAAMSKGDGYTIGQIPISVFRYQLVQGTPTTGQGFHLHRQSLGLCDHRAGRDAQRLQDLERRDRLRQSQSGQGHVCDVRRRHVRPYRHGTDGGEGRREILARAVQEQRRGQPCSRRRPHHAERQRPGIEADGRGRQARLPQHLDSQAQSGFRTCRR